MQNTNNVLIQNALLSTAFQLHNSLMVLKIFVDSTNNSDDLHKCYIDAINNHNNKILTDKFPDAGFDIFVANDILTLPNKLNIINFGVKCSAQMYHDNGGNFSNTGFYMYPRSSLSNTQLRFANSVGIIDSGYRGNLIGKFDCLYVPSNGATNLNQYTVNKFSKLVQICAPGLVPIYVVLVDSESDLGEETQRGYGGFGSTGI
jgi:dUTP pyrophosphatase